jgi:hypothetical protein
MLSRGYPEELDDEAVDRSESDGVPLSQDLADKIEDIMLPQRG